MGKAYDVTGDLFQCPYIFKPGVAIAHCISSDYALGAGFAKALEERCKIRTKLKIFGTNTYPDCLYVDDILNLVTKDKYWNKPTYETLRKSLDMAVDIINSQGIKLVVMPRIGSGLDRLDWEQVKLIINETILSKTQADVIVYHY